MQREKVERYVIPYYWEKRTWYHTQSQFQYARKALIDRLVRDGVTSILDVGCGHGLGSIEIMAKGIKYVGVDPNEDNLKQARIDNPRGDFRQGYMQELPFPDRSFDAVIDIGCWEILPSVEDMRLGLNEALRVARRRVYSLNATAKPVHMVERYMMVPMEMGLEIRRVSYDHEKKKSNYLWVIDLGGIH